MNIPHLFLNSGINGHMDYFIILLLYTSDYEFSCMCYIYKQKFLYGIDLFGIVRMWGIHICIGICFYTHIYLWVNDW